MFGNCMWMANGKMIFMLGFSVLMDKIGNLQRQMTNEDMFVI